MATRGGKQTEQQSRYCTLRCACDFDECRWGLMTLQVKEPCRDVDGNAAQNFSVNTHLPAHSSQFLPFARILTRIIL
jgi:hypothetical protein